MAYLLIFIILTNKKERIISIVITSMGIIIGIASLVISNNKPIMYSTDVNFEEGITIINCTVEDESIATVELDEEGKYMDVKSGTKVGTTEIKAIDTNNNEYIYIVESTSKDFEVKLKE